MGKATKSREGSYEDLKGLVSELPEEAELYDKNEAATRLEVVDEVLRVLGWEKSDFNPERPIEDGYIDYCLTIDGAPRLVVEAKSADRTFGETQKGFAKHYYSYSYLKSAFGQLMTEVVDQAKRYAENESVPFGVVTNGTQWILLRLLPIGGSSPEESEAIYFGDIRDEGFNFELFWNHLSRRAVSEGVLEKTLASLSELEAEKVWHASTRLGGLTWKINKNEEHSRFLHDFYTRFFGEIVDPGRRRMLEYCFVTNDDLDQYRGELKRVLRDTPPQYLDGADKIDKKSAGSDLINNSGDKKGDVVIVVGSVGAGKTTFIQKVLVEWRRRDEPLKSLRVNLIDEGVGPTTITAQTLWGFVHEQWIEEYPECRKHENLRSVFHGEVRNLREGPNKRLYDRDEDRYIRDEAELLTELCSDPEKFLTKTWRYKRERGEGVVVFLDNIDRASEQYQKVCYSFAHKLARKTGATVILTLREATYYRGVDGDFLDVRSDDRIYHMSAPNMRQVVSKRLKYLSERLEDDDRMGKWKREGDWDEFREAIGVFSSELKQALVSPDAQRSVIELITAASWHNVRRFFELLNEVHLALANKDGEWALDDVLSVLSAKRGGMDAIPSVYQPSHPRFPSYAIRIRVLYFLHYGVKPGRSRSGVAYGSLLQFVRRYGYLKSWCDETIEEMVRDGSLECVNLPVDAGYTENYSLSEEHSFRPSPIGVILIEELQFNPVYLALMGFGLPYQKKHLATKFVEVFSGLLEGSGKDLGVAGVDLLRESDLPKLVAHYLLDRFSDEKLVNKRLRSISEMEKVESRMEDGERYLKALCGEEGAPQKPNLNPPEKSTESEEAEEQLSFLAEMGVEKAAHTKPTIEIPQYLFGSKLGSSTHLPKIFWVLVDARRKRETPLRAAGITRRINGHLVEEHNQVESTNIARALRSQTAKESAWLARKDIGTHEVFGLSDDWEELWKREFGKEPPE